MVNEQCWVSVRIQDSIFDELIGAAYVLSHRDMHEHVRATLVRPDNVHLGRVPNVVVPVQGEGNVADLETMLPRDKDRTPDPVLSHDVPQRLVGLIHVSHLYR